MDYRTKRSILKIILEITALLAIGWVAGAEIGSWFGIQPIVERLPYEQQVNLEQQMLKSFGKVMPVIMPFSAVVAIVLAVFSRNDPSVIIWLRVIAVSCIIITIVTTLTINVPINNLTAKWELTEDFEKWSQMRARWHLFQGVRGGLFFVSFTLLTIASIIQRHPYQPRS
ncbi:MAG TPA: DUF1772 domain-containing protein [Chryseolinea sp.]|jgi:uncharacterized membrane protein|nr:DUF1772 domain-containing protein [Chryseolinea sp.]